MLAGVQATIAAASAVVMSHCGWCIVKLTMELAPGAREGSIYSRIILIGRLL
jgi:hypothetical protein